MASVAIIGAGPSGLAAAKAALEYGLEPTVFERAAEPGGLWRGGTGFAWPALVTNISRFTCVFSDHPWPEGTPDFPTAPAVSDYLLSYARRFGVYRVLQAGCTVIAMWPDDASWRVTWQHAGRRWSRLFDAVIVASGFFAQFVVPALRGAFGGLALHSGSYRSVAQFAGRKAVVVVGMAFSGSEIAAELSREGIPVTAVASRPFGCCPDS